MTDGFCPLAVTCPLPRALATTALLCRFRSHVWGGHAAFVLSGSSRLARVLQTRPCCHETPACFSAPWPLCSFRLGFAFSGDGEPSRVPGPVCPRSLCPERSVPTAPSGLLLPIPVSAEGCDLASSPAPLRLPSLPRSALPEISKYFISLFTRSLNKHPFPREHDFPRTRSCHTQFLTACPPSSKEPDTERREHAVRAIDISKSCTLVRFYVVSAH